MLFGGKKIQEKIVADAVKYAEEKDFLLIFGAMVGGCSKGLQYYDSDYDTRFLYLDKKEQRIFLPWEEKEDDLKHRKYFDDAVSPYEWIPLWEATSFFQFLKEPAFDGVRSFGLYNIVGWTLQSPYVWDPYGLAAKVMPLVNNIFRKDYYIPYHVDQIHILWNEEDSEFVSKNYLYAIYEALCILYADKYSVFPPVYMKTLAASLLEEELANNLFGMIYMTQKEAERYCLAGNSQKMHDSHYYGKIARHERYDNIIKSALKIAREIVPCEVNEADIDNNIKRIYRIIEESICREQKVARASD